MPDKKAVVVYGDECVRSKGGTVEKGKQG